MPKEKPLQRVYDAYGGQTGGVDSFKFMKLMKDSNLVDANLRPQDVDIIFTKAKPQGQRKLDYNAFQCAIELVSSKRGVSFQDLTSYLIRATASGPSLSGTVAQEVRFYDDRSTYTGVHKAGGPTVVDKDKQTLDRLLDRSPADARGLKKDMKEAHFRSTLVAKPPTPPSDAALDNLAAKLKLHNVVERGGEPPSHQPRFNRESLSEHLNKKVTPPPSLRPAASPPATHSSAPHPNAQIYEQYLPPPPLPAETSRHSSHHFSQSSQHPPQRHSTGSAQTVPLVASHIVDPEKALHETYLKFCSHHETQEMDSARFVKLCRDTGIVDGKRFTVTDADLIFQRSKKSGNYGKRISYEDFRMVSVPNIAYKLNAPVEDVVLRIVQTDGPSLNNATVPSETRFYDDKTTYTGVHTAGGPTLKDDSRYMHLENLLNRGPADVRGIPAQVSPDHHQRHSTGSAHAHTEPRVSSGGRATIAGEKNKPGGIFDRLSNKESFTGTSAEKFRSAPQERTEYRGHTNTGTDETVFDISKILNRR